MVNFEQPIYVPKYITRTILLLLPVKSLIRLCSVCKSWLNLIRSDQFNHTYHTSNNRPRQVFFISERRCHNHNRGRRPEIGHQHILQLESAEASRLEKMTLSETMQLEKYYPVVGHCNGIICLSTAYHCLIPPTILLWNPALRQCRPLPSTEISVFGNAIYSAGFGYDPTNQDYKVVRASRGLTTIQIHSLNSNSWKRIPSLEGYFRDDTSGGLPFKGRLFWIMKHRGFRSLVVCDLAKEKFSNFDLPETMRGSHQQMLSPSLGVFRGRVLLLIIKEECEMWSVEDDRCRPESWFKVLAISPLSAVLGKVGLGACWVMPGSIGPTADGKVFMVLRDVMVWEQNTLVIAAKALLYDVETNTVKVCTETTEDCYNWFAVVDYVETFVSIMPQGLQE